jgi:DNA-binding GntR family transcriptional regulator
MSDTYSRIRRAYRGSSQERMTAWTEAFDGDRIERLKELLDDLQSRLNTAGVALVRRHLDEWRDNVPERVNASGPPPLEAVRAGFATPDGDLAPS